MTTSLPDTDALFHVSTKIFQRSAGRSAVAAAAYRSASCLTDDRIGETFDYSKKHSVAAFILAPQNAPAWVLDREQLWNRVEAAEKRKDAQVARELEISIPRDIPREEWPAFAEAVATYYVALGAIADVAIHCPADVYGQPQPHLHIMLSPRALDAATETGFSRTKNKSLDAVFVSGGRSGGGDRGDALKIERERIANIMNEFLARAGSARRASHLSNAARGIDREPEPAMGEGRLHAARRRKRGDSKTRLVGAMRAARELENQLSEIEETIMSTNPKFQSFNGLRHQQNYKERLLRQRFQDLSVSGIGEKLHMVDVRNPVLTKIQARDGGWIEVENRMIKTYGTKGFADTLAKQISDAGYADHIERLDESARVTRKGQGLKLHKTRHVSDDFPEAPQMMPETLIETTADKWRSRGYTDVTEALDGVFVRIGGCRIQDLGDELRIHGKASDPAVRAMVEKAVADWGNEFEVYGSQPFKDAAWLEAQRQGAVILDSKTGKPYEPSPEIKKRWEADLAQTQKAAGEIEGIRQTKKLTEIMRSAASGDKKALESLHEAELYLAHFLVEHLDEAQLRELANESDESLERQLDGMREIGRDYAEEADAARAALSARDAALRDAGFLSGDGFDLDDQIEHQHESSVSSGPTP